MRSFLGKRGMEESVNGRRCEKMLVLGVLTSFGDVGKSLDDSGGGGRNEEPNPPRESSLGNEKTPQQHRQENLGNVNKYWITRGDGILKMPSIQR